MADEDFSERELITRFLKNREYGCPSCKYNLRDVTTGSCPECGKYLQLSIVPLERRDSVALPWLLSMALSLSVAPFAAMVLGSEIRGRRTLSWENIVYGLIVGLLILAVPLLAGRQRFLNAKKRTRWIMFGLVFVWWCAPIAIIVAVRFF